jgi:hypothetical protein
LYHREVSHNALANSQLIGLEFPNSRRKVFSWHGFHGGRWILEGGIRRNEKNIFNLKKEEHRSSSLVYDHVDDKRIEANKPFVFYGKKDKKLVELWFFSIEQYVAIRGIDNDKDWILFAITYFIGNIANRWMEFVWGWKDNFGMAPNNWAIFWELLEEEFIPMNSTLQICKQ